MKYKITTLIPSPVCLHFHCFPFSSCPFPPSASMASTSPLAVVLTYPTLSPTPWQTSYQFSCPPFLMPLGIWYFPGKFLYNPHMREIILSLLLSL